ncbi:hypothetical protein EV426DRAFT_710554 [Tirmania nivea]|nr:hypothetical protein EV426DRAFT_710554 [Tirmania nivea]
MPQSSRFLLRKLRREDATIHHWDEDHHRDVDHSVVLAVSTVSRPIWDQSGSKFGIAL